LLIKETSNASIGKCFLGDKKKDLLHSSHIIFIETLYGGDETVKASFDLKD
jgi:hypothetical protein